MKPIFQIKRKDDGCTLEIQGDLTIHSSAQFKAQLTELLEYCIHGHAEICIRAVTALDTSAIQLIYAAGRALSMKKLNVLVRWPENEKVDSLVTRTGFKQLLSFDADI